MKNSKLYLFGGLAILLIAAAATVALKKPEPAGMILFYGDTCPHCQAVEQYINANNIQTRLKFQELEVYHNQSNAELLGQYAKHCGLDTKAIGVPFFFTGQTCIVGQDEIINYFKQH